MKVYRLARQAFKNDLKGTGAEKYGGRWNNIGVPMLYSCEHRSLAVLEVAVHLQLQLIPLDYYMIELDIPENENSIWEPKQLPGYWNQLPHHPLSQNFGDAFIKEHKYLMMKVPSAIVLNEYNYLINPLHELTSTIKITDTYSFSFDNRLTQKIHYA
jgi:RES domain-containing protein